MPTATATHMSRHEYLDGPIDARLLRAVFGAAREQSITNEQLHEAIQVGFAKSSLKSLTRREAFQLLDGIHGRVTRHGGSGVRGHRRKAMGVHGHKNYDEAKDPAYMVNDRELQMLRDAAARRGWSDDTLTAFCQRQIRQDMPRTMSEFNRVFQPLKVMNRRDGR